MRCLRRGAPGIAAWLLVLPLAAAAQDAKKDLDKDKDKTHNSEKMLKAGQLTGKIVTVEESKRSIRLQIKYPVLNPGAVQGLANAQVALQQALLNKDPVGRAQGIANAQVQMAQNKLNMYNYRSQDVDLQTTEDVKVRLANPPEQLDEKGRPKRYTAKELKELKGPDPKLEGYQADFSNLRPDQVVTVSLVKKKDVPKVKPTGGKGKDFDTDLLNDYLPQISYILVIAEPAPR